MIRLFENYSSTQENKKEKMAPIVIKNSPDNILNRIHQYLTENSFEEVEKQKDFYELFGKKGIFEYTFHVIPNGLTSILNIYVFCEKKGKSRKELIKIRAVLKELFKEPTI